MKPSDDDVASAWLDDELTETERAEAEHDADVLRARDELSVARDAASRPVAVPPELRERHIARALDELEVRSTTATAAPVVDLASRRRVAGASWWMSRAAVVALVVGGLGAGLVVLADDGAEEADMATATLAADDPDAAGAAAEATRAGAGEEMESLTAPAAEEETAEEELDQSGVAPAGVSATASMLVTAEDLDPVELVTQLEARFGPPLLWPSEDTSLAVCTAVYDDRHPDAAPHLGLPIDRDGTRLELIVPREGPPIYVDPGSCDVVD